MPVILALGQSGISNFALIRKKIKQKCPLSQPINISNFALYVISTEIHLLKDKFRLQSNTVNAFQREVSRMTPSNFFQTPF